MNTRMMTNEKAILALVALLIVMSFAVAVFANDEIVEATEASEDTNEAKIGETEYATLSAAINAVEEGQTIVLLKDISLDDRLDINKSATYIIDLNGKTISGNGAISSSNQKQLLNVKAGNVTIKNGTITPTATQASTSDGEVNAIVVRIGAEVTLESLTVTVNTISGACAYAFEGGKITIKSGTYKNETTVDYPYKTGWKGLTLNQANIDTQLIFVNGGTFIGMQPTDGDDGRLESFIKDAVAKIGSDRSYTYYNTIASALEASGTNTITVFKDTSCDSDLTLKTGDTLVIEEDVTLTINASKTFTNNGTITNKGTITNNGTITVSSGATLDNKSTLTNNKKIDVYGTYISKYSTDGTPLYLISDSDSTSIDAIIKLKNTTTATVKSHVECEKSTSASVNMSYTLKGTAIIDDDNSPFMSDEDVFTVYTGSTLTVVKMTVDAITTTELVNNGTVIVTGTMTNNYKITNNGTITCSGTLTNDGTIKVSAGAIFEERNTSSTVQRFVNNNTIEIYGTYAYYTSGSTTGTYLVSNDSTKNAIITLSGSGSYVECKKITATVSVYTYTLFGSSTLNGYGSKFLANGDVLYIDDDATVTISAFTFASKTGTVKMTNDGTVTITGAMVNSSEITNTTKGTITINANGTLTNNGTIINNNDIVVAANGKLINNGTIEVKGNNSDLTVNGTIISEVSKFAGSTGTVRMNAGCTWMTKATSGITIIGTDSNAVFTISSGELILSKNSSSKLNAELKGCFVMNKQFGYFSGNVIVMDEGSQILVSTNVASTSLPAITGATIIKLDTNSTETTGIECKYGYAIVKKHFNSDESIPTASSETVKFKGWYTASTGGNKVDEDTTFSQESTTIYAQWELYTITVKVKDKDTGTITASAKTAKEGDEITLTITPATGYEFKEYVTVPALVIEDDKFEMPGEDVTITVVFVMTDYNVSFLKDGDGKGTFTPSKETANYGEKVYLTITPSADSYLGTITPKGATITIEKDDKGYFFSMPNSDITLTATFVLGKEKESETGEGTVDIPEDVAKTLGITDTSKLKIYTKTVTDPKQKNIPKGATVYDLSMVYDGNNISKFGGSITVTLDYVLPTGVEAKNVKVFCLSDDGTEVEEMEDATYISALKSVAFKTTHFSTYVITTEDITPEKKDSTTTILLIVLIAVIAIILTAVVVLMMRKPVF